MSYIYKDNTYSCVNNETCLISPTQFFYKMKQIDKKDDPEEKQSESERLIIDVLKQLGYKEGIEVFENMDRYSF